jgi:polysaccharide deacetylase 2 family uncharacterized protein YibQ
MSQTSWERNTSGMTAHAHRRREETRNRVEQVINRLVREQKAVNFTAVAKEAGVTKAYLYSQPDLRERIEALRQQQQEYVIRERVAHPTGKTDASKDLVILAKERRIKELEAEVQKLKAELKVAWGKVYEQL